MILGNFDVGRERWDFAEQWGSTFFYALLYYWHIEFGWRDGSPEDDLDLPQ